MKRTVLAVLFILSIALVGCDVHTSNPATTGESTADPHAISSGTSPDIATTEITPTFEGCSYVWASQVLPDISKQVDNAIKSIQPEASGRAQAYGENCVYADGHSDFTALETDFYITLNVKDLKDDKALGNWLINVMVALKPYPRGVVPGGQDGFVEVTFKSGDDQRNLRVDIDKFKGLPAGTVGSDVLKFLFSNP